jgi:hypothetical protein
MLEQRKPLRLRARPRAAPDQAASVKLKTLKELTLALFQEVESIKGSGSFEVARP